MRFGKIAPNRYFDKMGMYIPARIEGIPFDVRFQLDLGYPHTEIYENPLDSLYATDPTIKHKVGRLQAFYHFWDNKRSYKDITIKADRYAFKTQDCYLNRHFGTQISRDSILTKPGLVIGTIEIAGQKFNSVEIYADHRKEVQEADGTAAYLVTGNALFWNKTVIIDFRNKTFGVK